MKKILLLMLSVFLLIGSSAYSQNNFLDPNSENYYANQIIESSSFLKSSSIGANALVYIDGTIINDKVIDGLTAIGYTVTFASNWNDFNIKLAAGGVDIAVAFKQYWGGSSFNVTIAQNYINSGGRMVFTTWQTGDVAEAALFEAAFTGNANGNSVTILDPDIALGVTNPVLLTNPGYGIFSLGLSAIGSGEGMAVFNNGDFAIVRGNSGRTLMLGYLSDTSPDAERQKIFEQSTEAIIGASNDIVALTEDIPKDFNPTSNDLGMDPSTVLIIDSTANGNIALIQATGQITYTPNSNYFGNDVLKYSISDGAGDVDTASVFITVTPVNDAPLLANDTVVGWENVTIEIDVLTNDKDVELDELNLFATKTTWEGGSAWVLGNNISYSPPTGFMGNDVIEYEVCDNGSPIKCSKAKVYVTVTEINDLPVVDNEMVVVDEDGIVSGDLIDAGDSDPEGTELIANTIPIIAPANGVLVVAADGLFTYSPNLNFFGADMAVVKVCDQGLPVFACVPDTIFITVKSVNDAPVLTPTALTVDEDEPEVMVDISGNVVDTENNGLVTSVISGPATFPSMFNIAFSPAPNFNGTEVITYSVCDDAGACDTSTVTITVTPVNDPPMLISTFEDIEIQVGEKRDLLLDDLLDLLFDDVDEGDALTLSVVMANGIPLPAWVTITDGVLTSLPYGGNMGCYDLLFVATDHSGATATEPFTICVVNKNVATAIDDLSEIFEVSLYPNPSRGSVTLELGQSDINAATVSVYNIAGQKIHNQIYSENRIKLNLENQRSGMYYVKVITGSREVVKKLVLNRE